MAYYDADDISKYAGRLYFVSSAINVLFTLFGVFAGIIPAAIVATLPKINPNFADYIVRIGWSVEFVQLGLFILGIIVGGVIGLLIGDWVSFTFKLIAQSALALSEIAENTRAQRQR